MSSGMKNASTLPPAPSDGYCPTMTARSLMVMSYEKNSHALAQAGPTMTATRPCTADPPAAGS